MLAKVKPNEKLHQKKPLHPPHTQKITALPHPLACEYDPGVGGILDQPQIKQYVEQLNSTETVWETYPLT